MRKTTLIGILSVVLIGGIAILVAQSPPVHSHPVALKAPAESWPPNEGLPELNTPPPLSGDQRLRLQARLIDLESQRDQALERYLPDNEIVKAFNRQIGELNEQLQDRGSFYLLR